MTFATVPELLSSAAERFGDAPAVVTANHLESFAQLADAVQQNAGLLRNRNLQPGDRVLIAAPNSIPLVHAWLAAIWLGAVPAAVNPESRQAEIDYFRRDLDPRLVLTADDLEQLASADRSGAGSRAAQADPMETAAIVYTSGTTSRPKGVMVRHAAYTETGHSFPSWIGLTGRQRLWACLPLFHINAQAYSLMSSLAHGYPLALSAKFHASTFWSEAKELSVTSVNVVGAMLDFVSKQPSDAYAASSLRTIYSAPGPSPNERGELERRFQLRIVTGYGMSENPFGCAETPTSRDKAGSIGRPRQPISGSFTNELRIAGSDGVDAAVGDLGELCFRNPVMTPGYWNAGEVTSKTIRDGWLYTGDLGYRDQDGDVFLTGRVKDMIRRRGENVAPGEVEDALQEHPAVASAAVFGIAAGLQEEEVIAAVVLKNGATTDEAALRAFAAERLAPYKVPSRIAFRTSLPMTPTHRVAKDVLRQEYGRSGN
jgi:crotonobetaine/carnitine-CoA ligase